MKNEQSLRVLVLLLGGLLVPACGADDAGTVTDGGDGGGGGLGADGGINPNDGSGAGGTGGVGLGDGGGATGGAGGTIVPVSCPVAAPQCNDGMDNDMDGKIDSLDPECVGPCDNDEGTFATGIAGDNIDACKQDCFFDGNSGMGDDGCEWNLKCDSANPGGTSCPYDATYKNCPKTQSARCVRNCQKLAPNGCDCFGCCAVSVAGQQVSVMLVSTCTAAKFGDATACPRCTQNTACVNTCEKCEVCLGRPAPDPSCTATSGADGGAADGGADGGTPVIQCAAGITSCGPGGQVAATACGAGYYCQTGCCISQVTID
jgi:hypothetical protein